MNPKEIYEYIEKIGCLSITTQDENGDLQSRIISIIGADARGIYFLTMNVKPFFRQMKANSKLAACGIWPTGQKTGKNKDGQPRWQPGFTLRLSGEVEEVGQQEMEAGARAGDPILGYTLEDQERYPAIRLMRIHKAKGEIFDFDFEMEQRDHKVLRTRFSYGGAAHNEAGTRINADECIACGICADECTFRAIEPDESGAFYRCNGSRCDECGSCVQACPQGAIELPGTL